MQDEELVRFVDQLCWQGPVENLLAWVIARGTLPGWEVLLAVSRLIVDFYLIKEKKFYLRSLGSFQA
jgi:hypothetical protein